MLYNTGRHRPNSIHQFFLHKPKQVFRYTDGSQLLSTYFETNVTYKRKKKFLICTLTAYKKKYGGYN